MTCWFVRPLEWGDPEAGCLSQWEVIVLQTLSLARSLAAAAVGDWTESRRQATNTRHLSALGSLGLSVCLSVEEDTDGRAT